MNRYFADFHIHIGQSKGRPVKITAAKNMTLTRVLEHAAEDKGLDIVTVIDGVCPPVQSEVETLLAEGKLTEVSQGGLLYHDKLLVLLGTEVELAGPKGGAAHFGSWFPSLKAARDFSRWLATVQTNTALSSQRARTSALELQDEVYLRGGLFIVHHAFTPHKGVYGNCVHHLTEMLDTNRIDALELGLSANTDMADSLRELQTLSFITNSDAHSLPKIAREYNELLLSSLNFQEIQRALRRKDGRKIVANYGLEPQLGKYHRTTCKSCGSLQPAETIQCSCGSRAFTRGVYDRWLQLRDWEVPHHPLHRPPYYSHIPLEFIPGLGPRTLQKLIRTFGSEMAVLHNTPVADLAWVCGEALATRIDMARNGLLEIEVGGGGEYGKIRIN